MSEHKSPEAALAEYIEARNAMRGVGRNKGSEAISAKYKTASDALISAILSRRDADNSILKN